MQILNHWYEGHHNSNNQKNKNVLPIKQQCKICFLEIVLYSVGECSHVLSTIRKCILFPIEEQSAISYDTYDMQNANKYKSIQFEFKKR